MLSLATLPQSSAPPGDFPAAFHPLPQPHAGEDPIRAVYVHIPFCTVKCHYCDFFSVTGHLHEAPSLVAALETELQLLRTHFGELRPETLFVGGGTPTLLPPATLNHMLDILRGHIDLSALREFTIEANPNTFDALRAAILQQAGVTRLSFGAQSFVASELAALQRDHDPESVSRAVAMARDAGIDNINLDLIFAIPGQTLSSWDFSLDQALALTPQHLSCYGLTYEPHTRLTARVKAGEVTPASEELELELLAHTQQRLAATGFRRYEISNYARPGCECLHNLCYWNSANHLALGPAAWTHYGPYRWKNVASIGRYTAALQARPPQCPLLEMEQLEPMRRWGELAMLQLRLQKGLCWTDFQRRTHVDARKKLAQVRQKYEGLGVLTCDEHHLALTDRGVAVSDSILADVLAAFTS